jgi:hypothetical protein
MTKGGNSVKAIDWVILFVSLLYVLTGLGITQYRIIGALTLGLINKPVSFIIHDNLLVPFIILLTLHISIRHLLAIYVKRIRCAKG